ncbi:hypothetical protein D3C80_1737300 [compost metagenome]
MPGRIEEQLLGHIVIVVDVDVVDLRPQGGLDDRNGTAVERPHGVEHQLDAVEQLVQPGGIEHIGADGTDPRPQLGRELLGSAEIEVADHVFQLRVARHQLARHVGTHVATAQ